MPLPLGYRGVGMVRTEGFEPPTSGISSRHLYPLGHVRFSLVPTRGFEPRLPGTQPGVLTADTKSEWHYA